MAADACLHVADLLHCCCATRQGKVPCCAQHARSQHLRGHGDDHAAVARCGGMAAVRYGCSAQLASEQEGLSPALSAICTPCLLLLWTWVHNRPDCTHTGSWAAISLGVVASSCGLLAVVAAGCYADVRQLLAAGHKQRLHKRRPSKVAVPASMPAGAPAALHQQ